MKFTSNFWVKVISPPNIFQCVQRFMANYHWSSRVVSCFVTLQEVSKARHIDSFMERLKGSEQQEHFGKTIFRKTQGKWWFTLRNLEPPQYWPRQRKWGRERETSEEDERINEIFPQFHNCNFKQANPPGGILGQGKIVTFVMPQLLDHILPWHHVLHLSASMPDL